MSQNVASTITVQSVVAEGRVLRVKFAASGEVGQVFKGDVFEVEYSEDISKVPVSILVLPFIANVLPIAWVYDATIVVDEIDQDFLEHCDDIKSGYRAMYPKVVFSGKIDAKKSVRNIFAKEGTSALLFSGGADATSSLVTLLKEGQQPHLITLWGADVELDDTEGWDEKWSHTEKIAELFQLDASSMKTNFRLFLDESLLDRKVENLAGDQWWHGFQHGIGIIGHAAPLMYLHGLSALHIAASFTRGDNVVCASDPTIDEQFKVGDSKTVHDGYDFTRQDKIRNIHQYVSTLKGLKSLPIKVCWQSRGAKNCGQCEKCIRTACGIIAEGGDVDFYAIEKFDSRFAKRYIVKTHYFRHTIQWSQIQKRLHENRRVLEGVPDNRDISWLLDIDLSVINNHLGKRLKYHARNLARPILRVAPRNLKLAVRRRLNL